MCGGSGVGGHVRAGDPGAESRAAALDDPVRSTDYELKVPEGSAELVRARLAETGPDAAALNWHTVRKGETLLTISRKLKVSRADLADANYLKSRRA